jgi:hypothetical protein
MESKLGIEGEDSQFMVCDDMTIWSGLAHGQGQMIGLVVI